MQLIKFAMIYSSIHGSGAISVIYNEKSAFILRLSTFNQIIKRRNETEHQIKSIFGKYIGSMLDFQPPPSAFTSNSGIC
ncbi:hypothetical protein C0J52_02063 [Blattella germanica]|nr:hypothetical protein C0J52_02063 [Blattella germanica]